MKRAFLATAALLAQGCGTVCNEMYVYDHLAVSIESAGWVDGSYEVELSGDLDVSCAMDLADGQASAASCEDEDVDLLWAVQDETMRIEIRDPLPEYLHVALLLDGDEIATQVFEPTYEIDEPNGEGCGERVSATELWNPSD